MTSLPAPASKRPINVGRAIRDALAKLDPRALVGNPVILTTEVVAILSTVSAAAALVARPV